MLPNENEGIVSGARVFEMNSFQSVLDTDELRLMNMMPKLSVQIVMSFEKTGYGMDDAKHE